ncbi:hypothetical protein QF037_006355 [Streptomyces canus]|uniref:hypothetical protein n=1 Tax=Streptomyces canus TaxID=58343 RepID=UPI0027801829|nr:hypothetical protein [Streptomyces canus]MDQ0602010.1 hypothetical protein [Streptomyces canus]
MTKFGQRYWASLTDSRDENLESMDYIIEHGLRKDTTLWRRYIASLFDIELTDKRPAEKVKRISTAKVRSATSLVRKNWLTVAASVLLVFGAGFGTSSYVHSQTVANSPVVIGAAPTLPVGATNEAGQFAWVPPKGWRRDVKTGNEVHYTSPDGKQEVVGKSSMARGDLMDTWQTSEQNAHGGMDYRKIRLTEATFRGWPAVVWEYTFTLQDVPWHALLLGFNADGMSYQINTWYQPVKDSRLSSLEVETQALKTYSLVKDSFTVL